MEELFCSQLAPQGSLNKACIIVVAWTPRQEEYPGARAWYMGRRRARAAGRGLDALETQLDPDKIFPPAKIFSNRTKGKVRASLPNQPEKGKLAQLITIFFLVVQARDTHDGSKNTCHHSLGLYG